MTLRERFIGSGEIYPLSARPTLRIDARGEVFAALHIAEYLKDPERFQAFPFRPEPPPDAMGWS